MSMTKTLSPTSPPKSPMNILVADDHYASRIIGKSLLERDRHQVFLAENGEESVKLCYDIAFDIILMDIQMPIMDGVMAAAEIRALEDNPNADTAIFALTSYASAEEKAGYLNTGMNAVLKKPFRLGPIYRAYIGTKGEFDDRTVDDLPHVETGIPLLDDTIIMPLRAAASIEVLHRLCDHFWSSVDDTLERMTECLPGIQLGDTSALDDFRRGAHAIKGAASNIGALRAARIAAGLQIAAPEQIPTRFKLLDSTLAHTRPQLNNSFFPLIRATG